MKWSSCNSPWKLMTDFAINWEDRRWLADFAVTSSRLTQGPQVKMFEDRWSEWQGCKYSVFVNSGSAANLILVNAVQSVFDRPRRWAAQACTWSTTISPIIQSSEGDLAPELYLSDIDLKNFSPDLKELEKIFIDEEIEYLFLTHLLGFPSISKELLDLCKDYDVILLEDCCESHGATFEGVKVGNFGEGSTFSFYYGHHMTTIEGGMVCTDNEDVYHELLLLRSHGLLRELPPKERAKRKPEGVDPQFCFLRDGFNCRNTEMHAGLGIMQLKDLDMFIEIRNENFHTFIKGLDPEKYETGFLTEGVSNFALPIFVKDPSMLDSVRDALDANNVEHRPCIAGNINRHPLADILPKSYPDDNAEKVHMQCIYIGNHQDVNVEDVKKLCEILNEI
tara:strand:- start:193 stop:1371 length:1179 start_codon:yes stop_codon:yes gene_type:complete